MREKMMGGSRTDEQILADGLRLTLSQIDKLRNQLKQAERMCQYAATTGKMHKDDRAVWKRVAKAADKLLDGMLS
ncbi:MAG TPA: hypothetical protein VF637_10330 [Sphingomicrobium sp.]|jgi:isochorismate hydrolase